jgi:outer membrane protein assembly factor BamD
MNFSTVISFSKFLLTPFLFVCLAVLLIGCSSDEGNELETTISKKSAEDLYAEAKAMVTEGKYTKAIATFQEVERLYPFSNLAPKSQVMTAYSHYKNEDYDKAIGVIDSFVAINPGNAEIDFMYYLKATSYYDRISDVKRDQEITENAKKSFGEVMRRFANSDYARDSEYKINLINDHLAGKEMEIGRFYLKNRKYIAAINRFKEVFDKYQETPQIEEALYRIVETNKILGLNGEAKKYASILGHNYGNGKWYKRAYALLNGGDISDDAGDDDSSEGLFSGMFSGWFGGDDEVTDMETLHKKEDAGKIDKIFKDKINN